MTTKHVVFTFMYNDDGELELRATPGNVVVDLGAGDPARVKFTNLTDFPVEFQHMHFGPVPPRVRAMTRVRGISGFTIGPGASKILSVEDLDAGQYVYVASANVSIARKRQPQTFMVRGHSDPGIIVTP